MQNNEFYKGDSFDTIPLPDSVMAYLPSFISNYRQGIPVPNFCAFENDYRGFTYVGCTECDSDTNETFRIGVTFSCAKCKKYITIENDFSYSTPLIPVLYDYSFVHSSLPFSKDEINEIRKISNNFLEIYTQSQIAENMNLNEIIIGGYRKALETLVKDYLFNYKKFIKAGDTALMNCIKDHMNEFSQKTKDTLSLAVKIGNDGVHWESKFDFSVKYMKILIKMFCNDILNSIREDEASAIFDEIKTANNKKK